MLTSILSRFARSASPVLHPPGKNPARFERGKRFGIGQFGENAWQWGLAL
jgi:hypothetical protein